AERLPALVHGHVRGARRDEECLSRPHLLLPPVNLAIARSRQEVLKLRLFMAMHRQGFASIQLSQSERDLARSGAIRRKQQSIATAPGRILPIRTLLLHGPSSNVPELRTRSGARGSRRALNAEKASGWTP